MRTGRITILLFFLLVLTGREGKEPTEKNEASVTAFPGTLCVFCPEEPSDRRMKGAFAPF